MKTYKEYLKIMQELNKEELTNKTDEFYARKNQISINFIRDAISQNPNYDFWKINEGNTYDNIYYETSNTNENTTYYDKLIIEFDGLEISEPSLELDKDFEFTILIPIMQAIDNNSLKEFIDRYVNLTKEVYINGEYDYYSNKPYDYERSFNDWQINDLVNYACKWEGLLPIEKEQELFNSLNSKLEEEFESNIYENLDNLIQNMPSVTLIQKLPNQILQDEDFQKSLINAFEIDYEDSQDIDIEFLKNNPSNIYKVLETTNNCYLHSFYMNKEKTLELN